MRASAAERSPRATGAPPSRWRKTLRRFLRRPASRFGLLFLTVTMLPAIVGPMLLATSPTRMTMEFLQPPNASNWFGTDEFGRDVFIRVLYGARVSIIIGLSTAVAACSIGAMVGFVAGYFRRLEGLLMRFVDILMAFPALLLAMGIVAALGPRPQNVVIALTIVYIPRTARLVRSTTLSLREQDFVEAARALGSRTPRVLLRHILPNSLTALTVEATFVFAYAMLAEAGLSFIGIGIQPPLPSLGNILGDARVVLREAPWVWAFPGAFVVLMVMGINLLGDALREALDPRLQQAARGAT